MSFDINLNVNVRNVPDPRLDVIEANQQTIINLLQAAAIQEKQTNMTLAQLQDQVTKNTTVEEGAVTLITSMAAQFAASKTDPAAIQALADQLTKSAADLGAAVAANTAPPAPPAV